MTTPESRQSASIGRRSIPTGAVEGRRRLADGASVRMIELVPAQENGKGSILFMPGRGDFYEKYLETLEHWCLSGWRVGAADWRGQALSGRLGADDATGHVDDFGIWVQDLAEIWEHWRASGSGPYILAGHSMGGHIVLRAVAEGAVCPDAVILSAPMLGLRPAIMPSWLLHGFARLMARLGDPRRPAFRAPEKPGHPAAMRSTLLTHDPQRYADEAWWAEARPGLAMGAPSWGWLDQALASLRLLEAPGVLEGITQPVLIVATTRDRLVSYRAIERAARRIPRARLIAFGAEARHEILREADPVRDKAIAAIDRFLDETAQAG